MVVLVLNCLYLTRIANESWKAYIQWGAWDLRFYVVFEGPACPGDRSPYLSLTTVQGECEDHYQCSIQKSNTVRRETHCFGHSAFFRRGVRRCVMRV